MKTPSRFKIGLLFLLGLLFSVGILIWEGSGSTFGNTRSYLAFFDSSVEGLNAGAEVSYKGVQIGRVDSKKLAPDGNLVEVTVDLDRNFSVGKGQVLAMSQKGLAGSSYLALSPASADAKLVRPPFSFRTDKPVIPTLSGGKPGILDAARQLSGKLQSLPLDNLISKWADAGREAEQVLASKDIDRTLQNLREASARADTVLQTLSRPDARRDMRQTLDDLAASASAIHQASSALQSQLAALPPGAAAGLSDNARTTLDDLQVALHRLNLLLPHMDELVRTLRKEPGRVTVRHQEQEPFKK